MTIIIDQRDDDKEKMVKFQFGLTASFVWIFQGLNLCYVGRQVIEVCNFQIKGSLIWYEDKDSGRSSRERTFMKLDVKIKRDRLRLIEMREFNELSIIEKKTKLHSVMHS